MIVGSLPFVGVSYQSEAKDQQYARELAAQQGAIATIYEHACALGIRKFAASPFPAEPNRHHIAALRELGETHPIEVMPCVSIPLSWRGAPVDVYRRWATVYRAYATGEAQAAAPGAVLHTFLTDPILQFRPHWQQNLEDAVDAEHWYTTAEIAEIQLDKPELEAKLATLAPLPIREVEYGSEVDLLLATGRVEVVGELLDLAQAAGYAVAVGIHHAGLSLPKLRATGLAIASILTPLNAYGVMMFPSRERALAEMRNLRGTSRLIGIKCLAGGRIPPGPAFEFLKGKLDDFMVGVASVAELRTAVEAAKQVGLRI